MPKDALTRRRGRRPAWFCQEQTLVLTEQFSSMERDAFHVSYLSDKIPEAVFHGQAVKTVAYLRVSTAQQDVRSQPSPSSSTHANFQDRHRQAHGHVPYDPLQLHEDPGAQAEPLVCTSTRIWPVP